MSFSRGDWIVHKYGTNKIVDFINFDCVEHIKTEVGGYVPTWKCKKWEPEVGEWCWVDFQLRQFLKITKEEHRTLYKFIDFEVGYDGYKGYKYIPDTQFKDRCQPFIGRLPTFIKEEDEF